MNLNKIYKAQIYKQCLILKLKNRCHKNSTDMRLRSKIKINQNGEHLNLPNSRAYQLKNNYKFVRSF